MVHWAYFEQSVRRGVWEVMSINARMGRIGVRDPRIDDRIEMIKDVAFLRKIKIDEDRINDLKSKANEIISWRDLLAHGVWIHHQDQWFLQSIAGSYPKSVVSEHRKRRIGSRQKAKLLN